MKNGKGGSQNLTFGILINFPLFPKCKNFFSLALSNLNEIMYMKAFDAISSI